MTLDGYPAARPIHGLTNLIYTFRSEKTTGEPGWVAVSADWPDAMGQGDTDDEAVEDCRLAVIDLRAVLDSFKGIG